MSESIKLVGFEIAGMPGVMWEKSSDSTPGTLDDCVVVGALADGNIGLGDTKTCQALSYRGGEFAKFIAAAKRGEFDHFIG